MIHISAYAKGGVFNRLTFDFWRIGKHNVSSRANMPESAWRMFDIFELRPCECIFFIYDFFEKRPGTLTAILLVTKKTFHNISSQENYPSWRHQPIYRHPLAQVPAYCNFHENTLELLSVSYHTVYCCAVLRLLWLTKGLINSVGFCFCSSVLLSRSIVLRVEV